MLKANSELTLKARKSLENKWDVAVGAYFLYMIILGAGSEVGLVIGGPMQLGSSEFSLNLARGKKADYPQIFNGFSNFVESLVAYLWMVLFILLWALLLIIPGIIAAIAYSQTFYILSENKNMKGREALDKSKAMMEGHKWKFFMLTVRFFGWFLLSILTFGIGFLFLVPYMHVTFAHFYDDLKKHSKA